MLRFLFLAVLVLPVHALPKNWLPSRGCKAPKVGDVIMGTPAKEGTADTVMFYRTSDRRKSAVTTLEETLYTLEVVPNVANFVFIKGVENSEISFSEVKDISCVSADWSDPAANSKFLISVKSTASPLQIVIAQGYPKGGLAEVSIVELEFRGATAPAPRPRPTPRPREPARQPATAGAPTVARAPTAAREAAAVDCGGDAISVEVQGARDADEKLNGSYAPDAGQCNGKVQYSKVDETGVVYLYYTPADRSGVQRWSFSEFSCIREIAYNEICNSITVDTPYQTMTTGTTWTYGRDKVVIKISCLRAGYQSGDQNDEAVDTTAVRELGFPNINRIPDQDPQASDRYPSVVRLSGINSGLDYSKAVHITAVSTNTGVVQQEVLVIHSPGASEAKLAYRTGGVSGSGTIVVSLINGDYKVTTEEFRVTTVPAPIDCEYTEFSPFGSCSALCGMGLKTRAREVKTEGAYGGRLCDPNTLKQHSPCQLKECSPPRMDTPKSVILPLSTETRVVTMPIENFESDDPDSVLVRAWTDGEAGNEVAVSNIRTVVNAALNTRALELTVEGGKAGLNNLYVRLSDMHGHVDKQTFIDITSVPVDCVVAWGAWGNCSEPCGRGTQQRTQIIRAQPQNGGQPCTPTQKESRTCEGSCADVGNCEFVTGAFGFCTKTCGGGTRIRTQVLTQSATNGAPCDRLVNEIELCNMVQCSTDCKLGWSNWTSCSKPCGSDGVRKRRPVVVQKTAAGGKECVFPNPETEPCNRGIQCATDCVWDWSEWSSCDQECGGGKQRREVIKVITEVAGGSCAPKPIRKPQEKKCNTFACNKNTCKDRCGKKANSNTGRCGCDIGCTDYCCSDLPQWCPQSVVATQFPTTGPTLRPTPPPTFGVVTTKSTSCKDRCGDRPNFSLAGAQAGVCSCDAACLYYSDCCADYSNLCAAGQTSAVDTNSLGFGGLGASTFQCQGNCGTVGPNNICSCESDCGAAGGIPCCEDYPRSCATKCTANVCGKEINGCFCTNDCQDFGDCCSDVGQCPFATDKWIDSGYLGGKTVNNIGRRRRL